MGTKPMLFNTEMVRAILSGQKVCTRRLVKPQHLRVLDSPYHRKYPETPDKVLLERLCEPPCRPGDILYVRETWRPHSAWSGSYTGCEIEYKAGGDNLVVTGKILAVPKQVTPWRPSIHMPKEAARIFLRVTDVRVERLQEITNEGALNEGIRGVNLGMGESGYTEKRNYREAITFYDSAKGAFAHLWDSTVKPVEIDQFGWAANPWVWVIEFERISREEVVGK